ncbi:amine oxidase [Pseudoroseomonas deserti]|uniref:Amine oxidase n=2 Tax=Teichococcus deserti TaxID=1817963 RepID=A0A1V2H8K4_9PROT|nr:amine oxidase [Pseudoroseomonas deserti]
MSLPVLIVGGGLAGLTAAHLLHRAGNDVLLLEARERLGGRILSADAAGQVSEDGFDLGPSWFWPDMQPAMGNLIAQLGLSAFPQHDEGDVLVERNTQAAPQRYPGMRQMPRSMRLAGGTGAVVAALASTLPQDTLRTGARVTHLALEGTDVEVTFSAGNGSPGKVKARHVLMAVPPRLLQASVTFRPALDAATSRRWRTAPTWMAPHAKFVAIYDRAFWRAGGLSGMAQSMVGPLADIHDATTATGKAALFGFLGVPAARRTAVGREAIIAASVQQLARLFGPEAGVPRATLLKDWAFDPLTATPDDQAPGGHPMPATEPWVTGEWQGRIWMAGSEASHTEPGYLAGAVEAGGRTARDVIDRLAGARAGQRASVGAAADTGGMEP